MAKHVLTIKDTDRIGDFIDDAVRGARPLGISDEEWDEIECIRGKDIHNKFKKWIEHSEYLRIEFDLDAGTATVLPVN